MPGSEPYGRSGPGRFVIGPRVAGQAKRGDRLQGPPETGWPGAGVTVFGVFAGSNEVRDGLGCDPER